MYRLTGLPLVFTLECNYNRGSTPNELQRRHLQEGVDSGSLSPEGPPSREISPKYDPQAWGDIGKSIGIAALDMIGANPASRLGPPARRQDDLRRMRASVQIWAGRMHAQPNVCCPSDEEEEEAGLEAPVVCEEVDEGGEGVAIKPPASPAFPSKPASPSRSASARPQRLGSPSPGKVRATSAGVSGAPTSPSAAWKKSATTTRPSTLPGAKRNAAPAGEPSAAGVAAAAPAPAAAAAIPSFSISA